LESSGCFECLFTSTIDDDEDILISNRASFAAPNQTFSKDIAGCANRFTPYGASDAVRTASLAARTAIQVLQGLIKGNPLISWKGDASDFLKNGYNLSHRYHLTEEELKHLQYEYKNNNCPVCRQRDLANE
jgi:molybdopterin-synthase adenylyltransferase